MQYKVGSGEWTDYTSTVCVSVSNKTTIYARCVNGNGSTGNETTYLVSLN